MLQETPTQKYAERTEWNVRDSDATVVFSIAAETQGGTRLTLRVAERLDRPVLHLSREALERDAGDAIAHAATRLLAFVAKHNVRRLNVAGPRASQEPEIGVFVKGVLERAFDA